MVLVQDVMNVNMVKISPTATIGEAIQVLIEDRISGVPVVDGDRLVGIISEVALFDVLFDPSLRSAPVADFMTRDVRTVEATDTLGHVVHMFALYGIRRLPVVRDGKLVGLVSRRDLLRYAIDCQGAIAEPLAAILSDAEEPACMEWSQVGMPEVV